MLMKRQREIEDSSNDDDRVIALQESDIVQQDETLDWKISTVDIVNSRMFTPKCKRVKRNKHSWTESAQTSKQN